MSKKIRVLLVDDHAMVRKGLVVFLKIQAGLELVGEARDGADAFVSKIDPPQRLLAAIKRGEQAIIVPTKAGTHTCT